MFIMGAKTMFDVHGIIMFLSYHKAANKYATFQKGRRRGERTFTSLRSTLFPGVFWWGNRILRDSCRTVILLLGIVLMLGLHCCLVK